MSLFRRRKPAGPAYTAATSEDREHLLEFIQTRRGVEGFVEPQTAVTPVTLLLVAFDGEWTRRRVGSVADAHRLCEQHQLPSYDAAVVGIPQRMREYNKMRKQRGY